jgi:hypothetical protein
MLFSFYGEVPLLKRDPLAVPAPAGGGSVVPAAAAEQQQQQQFGVLMKDSVSHFLSSYVVLIGLRVVGALFFGFLTAYVSPMMSWDVSYPSWLAALFLKDGGYPSSSRYGLFDALLVVTLLAFTVFLSQGSLIKLFLRSTATAKSFYARAPWLRHVLLLLAAALLAANDATVALREAAAMRGSGENLHAAGGGGAPQEQSTTVVASVLGTIHEVARLVLARRNPWSLVSKVHYIVGATKAFLLPLMVYSRSEATLRRLGVPASMISLNGEAMLLDNGRALALGLVMSTAWAVYIATL